MNNETESPEWEYLIFFCKKGLTPKTNFPKNFNQNYPPDWAALIRMAARHRVRPLLYKGILNWEKKDLIPTEYLEELKDLNFQITTKNLNQTKELIRILRLFEKDSVETIPLKGVTLTNWAYGDLGSREFNDLDLLIRITDFSKIKTILIAQNYLPKFELPQIIENQFIRHNCEANFEYFQNGHRVYHIEPHWFIGDRMAQLNFDYNHLECLTNQKELFGLKIKALSPEGLIITVCMHHGGKDQWKNLKQVCDIAAILFTFKNQINWHFVLTKTNELKITNLILHGIGLAVELFEPKIPNNVFTLIQSEKIKIHVQKSVKRLHSDSVQKFSKEEIFQSLRFHFSVRKYWSTKLKIVWYHFVRMILPNLDDVKDRELSKTQYWLLFFQKPIRLWKFHFGKKDN